MNSADWMAGVGGLLSTAGRLGSDYFEQQRLQERDKRELDIQEENIRLMREQAAKEYDLATETLKSNERISRAKLEGDRNIAAMDSLDKALDRASNEKIARIKQSPLELLKGVDAEGNPAYLRDTGSALEPVPGGSPMPDKKNGFSMTTNPDGTTSISYGPGASTGAQTKALESTDAKLIQKASEQSSDSASSEQMLRRARELIDSGEINTGVFGQAKKLFWQVADEFNFDSSAADYEEFESISKNLGAEALKLFGGSDTERELITAIETGPALNKTEKANRSIIDRKLQAIDILQRKPDFQNAWIQRNGSLSKPDQETGEQVWEAWRRYQKEEFGSSGQANNDPLGLRNRR